MNDSISTKNLHYFQGNSLSDLFAPDITDAQYAFILNYPATATWAAYPNTGKYYIQDGSSESTKTPFRKICQQEPWKNLAVLGKHLPGVVIAPPPQGLIHYWQEHFDFGQAHLEMLDCSTYLDDLNQSREIDHLITLFPFDHLKPGKHAVVPDTHYHLLSKVTLADIGVQCPTYQSYSLQEMDLAQIPLPAEFPYLIKTSHGLSGEGTYIIHNASDLNYCREELQKYLKIRLLDQIVVSEFIPHAVSNYCVQFYVNKAGEITLIGTTYQLVSAEGDYLGGMIDYQNTPMDKFLEMIAQMGQYAHQQGYFGVVGFDVLEDREGQLYAIDANFRVNGSTPLCLQRHTLRSQGKQVAKYFSDYRMDGALDSILVALKPELDRKDFLILSALERVHYGRIYTDMYGIVTGETIQEMQRIEQALQRKGLQVLR